MSHITSIAARTESVPLPFPIPTHIQGYMHPHELVGLYQVASRLAGAGVPGDLLEIGSYKGLSAAALGQTGNLTCVDTFAGGGEIAGENLAPAFFSAMTTMGLSPRVVCGKSQDMLPKLSGPYRLILVDGSHEYAVVRADLENSWRLLSPGGILVIDDYIGFDDVTRAADEFAKSNGVHLSQAGVASKMVCVEKPMSTKNGHKNPLVLLMRVIRGQWERCEVGKFLVGAALHGNPLFNVTLGEVDQEPTSCARNNCIGIARDVGASVLVMVDADMLPSMSFFRYAVEFLLSHTGPVVIGSPYCGAPHDGEQVHVMRKGSLGAERVSRDEASFMTGTEQVYCVGTGLFAANVAAFDLLTPPQFDYEYEGPERRRASSEDFAFCRRFSDAGGQVFVAWDHWSGHWKGKACLKPEKKSEQGNRHRAVGRVPVRGCYARDGRG